MTKPDSFTQAVRTWVDVSTQRSMRGWSHHAKATGLSMPQFSIMMQLYYRGACGLSEISERFEITNAAASQHVDNLVQAGLIERTEDPHDRRAKHIQLSAKGKSLIERGISERYRWVDQLAQSLSEKERVRTVEALSLLTEAARNLEQK
ncbi:MAG TPA: MarR family transcriptional regulator [Anaerolineales bacterium]|nr:MarR family transcriptional regulator [Anaerolineales bacterium]